MSAAVVKLPTAAPRKVRQCMTNARYAAKRQLPQFPADRCKHPSDRRFEKEAQLILDADERTALRLCMALVAILDDAERARLEVRLAAQFGAGNDLAARQALAMVRLQHGTVGHQHFVLSALHRLQDGEA